MDFLLVVAEWLDIGITGVGLLLGTVLYRRRALITDTLWWVREAHRRRAMAEIIARMRHGPRSEEDVVKEIEHLWGHGLDASDRAWAHFLWHGINWGEGEDSEGGSEA